MSRYAATRSCAVDRVAFTARGQLCSTRPRHGPAASKCHVQNDKHNTSPATLCSLISTCSGSLRTRSAIVRTALLVNQITPVVLTCRTQLGPDKQQ